MTGRIKRGLESTLASNVRVIARGTMENGDPVVVYETTNAPRVRWAMAGRCNNCGLCLTGMEADPQYVWSGPMGTPDAVRDTRVPGRPDDPVTPDIVVSTREYAAQLPLATVTQCAFYEVPLTHLTET